MDRISKATHIIWEARNNINVGCAVVAAMLIIFIRVASLLDLVFALFIMVVVPLWFWHLKNTSILEFINTSIPGNTSIPVDPRIAVNVLRVHPCTHIISARPRVNNIDEDSSDENLDLSFMNN